MEKRFILVVAVILTACHSALAQTSSPVVEPTMTPTPTPLPPPTKLKNQTFILYNGTSTTEVCLHMTVAIDFNITYINEANDNKSMAQALTDGSAIKGAQSKCNSTSYVAELYLEMDSDEMDSPVSMMFEFKGDSAKKSWSLGDMTFHVQPSFLKDYNRTTAELNFTTTDKLHQDPNANIDNLRSYICNSSQTLKFNMSNSVHPVVTVSQLQVQAFSFKNTTGGGFDDARTCLLDTAGKANKIVPIAVGAALAGLVVVVLIAYLIGRLRSRRQSSYEALS